MLPLLLVTAVFASVSFADLLCILDVPLTIQPMKDSLLLVGVPIGLLRDIGM